MGLWMFFSTVNEAVRGSICLLHRHLGTLSEIDDEQADRLDTNNCNVHIFGGRHCVLMDFLKLSRIQAK